MTRWLRTVRTTGLVIALGTGGAVLLPYDAVAKVAQVAAMSAGPTPGVHASEGTATHVSEGAATHVPEGAATHVPHSPRETASPAPSAASPRPGRHAPAPHAEPSRAGSLAGEGRERPGRRMEDDGATEEADSGTQDTRPEDTGAEDTEPEDTGAEDSAATDEGAEHAADGAATAVPEASRRPVAPSRQPVEQSVTEATHPTEPVLRVLPLGSGLVLIGLGLALALLGMRLRRG
ncbi:hypothetical protein ACIHIX_11290 [Streptomyces sp. NPDC051913]|uniref:hypothetical protein n=1 Tax=Streptomyces sp. NPDC051913 TaxID=3365676 RepID=UPI0037CFBE5C